MSGGDRRQLKHGYTNDTSTDGRRVIKRYLGPDAELRRRRELMIYDKLARQLPLPRLLASHADRLELQWLPGVPGQELLEDQPDAVLTAIGQLARQVHDVDLDQLSEADRTLPGGSVLVHGDFGPQNVLLDPETAVPTALVDWELTHIGHRFEDLAWAEWIVRTHHAAVVDRLPALFDGYGDRPAWADRHAAMIDKCHWALDFVGRWESGDTPATALWRQRLAATQSFVEHPTRPQRS